MSLCDIFMVFYTGIILVVVMVICYNTGYSRGVRWATKLFRGEPK